MLIHSVTLNNIRSYREQTIVFEEGTTLLAGDIGSGKSTILLAIEFALFGIRRGDISGDGLLRHGETEGSVTLTFQTDQTYTIHRSLKRSSQGVRQDGGYLEANGEQELLTANELKARILVILGYPEALLTKTKGFVFRYTVYTPQEELKHILYENDQSRLDTLRAVFGVDRYQLIQDNAQTLAKRLRDDRKLLVEQLADEEELNEKERSLTSQHAQATKEAEVLQQAIEQIVKQRATTQQLFDEQESLLSKERERQQQLVRILAQEDSLKRQVAQLSSKITSLQSVLAQERSEIENPAHALEELSSRILDYKEKRAQARAKQDHLLEQARLLKEKNSSINTLSTCPVCQQDVGADHKDHIAQDIAQELAVITQKQSSLSAILERLGGALADLSAKQSSLAQRKRLYEEYVLFTQKQGLAKQDLERLLAEEKALSQELSQLQTIKRPLQTPLADDATAKELSQTLRALAQQESENKQGLATLSERISQLSVRIAETQEAVLAAKKKKALAHKISVAHRWLTHAFIPTVSVMEKHVLAAIHQEFSRLFTQWCQMLLDNEHIFAFLSESFAPQVTLAGYDADITHLSGGEKTSLALAYRLALNVVVNEFIQSLRTSDVLILDEPTDGFSSDQLDRVRDVLSDLSVRQILVVSHEQKMQSYVEHVLTVTKHEGVSSVE